MLPRAGFLGWFAVSILATSCITTTSTRAGHLRIRVFARILNSVPAHKGRTGLEFPLNYAEYLAFTALHVHEAPVVESTYFAPHADAEHCLGRKRYKSWPILGRAEGIEGDTRPVLVGRLYKHVRIKAKAPPTSSLSSSLTAALQHATSRTQATVEVGRCCPKPGQQFAEIWALSVVKRPF